MYEVDQLVVYGTHGVCRIVDTEEKRVDKKMIVYFVLEPLDQPGTKYYIPSQNAAALAKIRPLMPSAQLKDLLSDQTAEPWILEDNRRKLRYREILTGVGITEILCMLRTIYIFRRSQSELGRKLHQCDEVFVHDAEKMLSSEISVVLDMPKAEALAYLREQLSA